MSNPKGVVGPASSVSWSGQFVTGEIDNRCSRGVDSLPEDVACSRVLNSGMQKARHVLASRKIDSGCFE